MTAKPRRRWLVPVVFAAVTGTFLVCLPSTDGGSRNHFAFLGDHRPVSSRTAGPAWPYSGGGAVEDLYRFEGSDAIIAAAEIELKAKGFHLEVKRPGIAFWRSKVRSVFISAKRNPSATSQRGTYSTLVACTTELPDTPQIRAQLAFEDLSSRLRSEPPGRDFAAASTSEL